MSASSRISQASVQVRRPGWGIAFFAVVMLSIAGLLLMPWSIEAKSIAILHGLCAQRPSHSFWFGPDRLPFGSRMTGIYGGFIITQLYLLVRGRFRASGVPSVAVLSMLLIFVVVMGLDGLNSTLDDVRLFTVYPPNNVLRLVTGALTGTTLAVFLWLLTSNILWDIDHQRSEKVIGRVAEFVILGLPIGIFGAVAMSGWRWIYPWIALFLVGAGILVIFELSICFIQLTRHQENAARSLNDLGRAALWSLLAAYVFMASMSGVRFLLEATLNLRQLQ